MKQLWRLVLHQTQDPETIRATMAALQKEADKEE